MISPWQFELLWSLSDFNLTAQEIADGYGDALRWRTSRQSVGSSMRALIDAGLVRYVDSGPLVYGLTDKGRAVVFANEPAVVDGMVPDPDPARSV